jgi:hypothetical protein
MRKWCPLTKKEAFARLDKKLSDEEKKEILKAKDMVVFHFSLGMWIRNTWIYANDLERVEALAKEFGEEFYLNADFLSSAILDEYKKHLKEKL